MVVITLRVPSTEYQSQVPLRFASLRSFRVSFKQRPRRSLFGIKSSFLTSFHSLIHVLSPLPTRTTPLSSSTQLRASFRGRIACDLVLEDDIIIHINTAEENDTHSGLHNHRRRGVGWKGKYLQCNAGMGDSASLREKRSSGCCLLTKYVAGFAQTVDTNSAYLAKFCFSLGIQLKRVEVIADDEDEIIEAARRMSKNYDFVVTSGGIGPTYVFPTTRRTSEHGHRSHTEVTPLSADTMT